MKPRPRAFRGKSGSGPRKGRDLSEVLRSLALSEETLDAIDSQVKRREAEMVAAPEPDSPEQDFLAGLDGGVQ